MAKTHEINDWFLPEELAVGGTPVLVLYVDTDAWKTEGGFPGYSKSAGRHEGAARFLIINTDENPSVLAERRIKTLPTLVLYTGGEEVARRTGPLAGQAAADLLARKQKRS